MDLIYLHCHYISIIIIQLIEKISLDTFNTVILNKQWVKVYSVVQSEYIRSSVHTNKMQLLYWKLNLYWNFEWLQKVYINNKNVQISL